MNNDINKYINHKLIITDLAVCNKQQAIEELVARIFAVQSEETLGKVTLDEVRQAILHREGIQSTGLGNAVAFPHTRLEGFGDLSVAIGICPDGVDWGSSDGEQCKIICLMVSPTNRPYLILQTMAVFSRFFSNTERVENVLKERKPEKIAEMIKASQMSISKSVLAKDVMRLVEKKVKLEDSIEDTAHIMHLNRLDILPVVDENNILVGEIS
ncbi:MAG: PTS sugar transporter subunit IIA, partial [Phycisphaerae bacterium]|nr:PTS sugar transporter subunit IIA [Phycisphaerae bacterium]